MQLNEFQQELCTQSRWDFSDLKGLFINYTLKKPPEVSHPQGLMDIAAFHAGGRHRPGDARWRCPASASRWPSWRATTRTNWKPPAIMKANGVNTETLRALDHQIAPGVYGDMTEHGWDRDDWPAIYQKVHAADILVIGSPIWLGEKSSLCTLVIERVYSTSHQLNDEGQYAYYGKVGGCLVTGNEDGVKHIAMNVLYSLQHLGYVIPPQADAGWVGEAGPGPSYLDPGSGGPENDFTNRNTTFMTWNLLHMARLLKDAGGVAAHGNQRSLWDVWCRFDYPNPEYR